MGTTPYYNLNGITIYCSNCLDILPTIDSTTLITDPPYPNNANHFIDQIETAKKVLLLYYWEQIITFWTEIENPVVNLPLVAKHIWHRTNSNRPDNYEAIYQYNIDNVKRASKVFPFCVIYPGLTGIKATGHPTEKHVGLMKELVVRTTNTVIDPFMGSGTTLVAAKELGRQAIGIEIDENYCEIAVTRLEQEVFDFNNNIQQKLWK